MKFKGQIIKMSSVLAEPIQYFLNLSGDLLNVNQLFGKKISIEHIGYQCTNCGKEKPVFEMGFCKQCFFESAKMGEYILRPELSKAHLGIEDRDFQIESQNQLQPHIVYLAYTGDVKIGVTRQSQVPTRWIDQGATLALPIARTTNRYEAGMIEVELKKHLSDKTYYKKMLADNPSDSIDLQAIRDEIQPLFPADFQQFYTDEAEVQKLTFPYQAPEKVSVVSFKKQRDFQGVLSGIKGQYLAFEDGFFINVRSHEGFVIEMDVS